MNSSVSGNCVTCVMEGSRPILIEIQALVTPSNYSTPQRTASGFDQRRLSLLIAVLEKRAAMSFAGQDVYLNIAGGLKINDTAADLAVVSALASSLKDKPIAEKSLYIGEVGLGGEVRRIPFLKQRLSEAEKMGFKHAVLPVSKTAGTSKMNLKPADQIMKAL